MMFLKTALMILLLAIGLGAVFSPNNNRATPLNTPQLQTVQIPSSGLAVAPLLVAQQRTAPQNHTQTYGLN